MLFRSFSIFRRCELSGDSASSTGSVTPQQQTVASPVLLIIFPQIGHTYSFERSILKEVFRFVMSFPESNSITEMLSDLAIGSIRVMSG